MHVVHTHVLHLDLGLPCATHPERWNFVCNTYYGMHAFVGNAYLPTQNLGRCLTGTTLASTHRQ